MKRIRHTAKKIPHPARLKAGLLALCLVAMILQPGLPRWSYAQDAREAVILLHGLARSNRSMNKLENAIINANFMVVNIDYPSTTKSIEQLSHDLAARIEQCCSEAPRLHFVTHSLGGIIVRFYLSEFHPANLGRVVMLSPPNSGSHIVDLLGDTKLFQMSMGPAAQELGTDAESLPQRLGPVDFELGVITGDTSANPVFSWLIPGDDDGQVSIESAKVPGMADFLVLPENHTFIMRSDEAIRQALHFVKQGGFDRSESPGPS